MNVILIPEDQGMYTFYREQCSFWVSSHDRTAEPLTHTIHLAPGERREVELPWGQRVTVERELK